jgi:hypothetical protein
MGYRGRAFRHGRRLAILAAFVVAYLPAPSAMAAFNSAYQTRSYYVATTDQGTLNHLGCETAMQGRQGRMTLFFGSPIDVNGAYGATLWGAPNQTTTGVGNLVKAFIQGYDGCASGSIFMRLGVGTSNCLIDPNAPDSNCVSSASYKTSTWVRNHGKAWGQMVNSLGTWIANTGHGDRVYTYAAWDTEPAWSSFARADAWMHGYDFDAPNEYALFANFSADGCPTGTALNATTNYSCANGWTLYRMWHEAWDHAPSWPFPQIYSSSLAQQWLRIGEYGYHAQYCCMSFIGALAQYASCSCSNTPKQAHDQLMAAVQSHSHTSQSDFVDTSDVGWSLHDH